MAKFLYGLRNGKTDEKYSLKKREQSRGQTLQQPGMAHSDSHVIDRP